MDFETLLAVTKGFSLVWFFAIFVVVLFRTFNRKNRDKFESYAMSILDKE